VVAVGADAPVLAPGGDVLGGVVLLEVDAVPINSMHIHTIVNRGFEFESQTNPFEHSLKTGNEHTHTQQATNSVADVLLVEHQRLVGPRLALLLVQQHPAVVARGEAPRVGPVVVVTRCRRALSWRALPCGKRQRRGKRRKRWRKRRSR
jgi:hypothetical protein